MKILSYILYPFSLVYGTIASLRRTLFEWGFPPRRSGKIKSLVVGNLTVGGTGKTPMVIWLLSRFSEKNPAVLSRGYGRKTKGFLQLGDAMSSVECGDEPMEIFKHFQGKNPVYVCENRVSGIEKIFEKRKQTGLVILDDGFQHLPLKPDFALLLCQFQRPFFDDLPMPSGRLREFAYQAKNADAIVVTKCPADMSMELALQWFQKLSRYSRPVFFATYTTETPVTNQGVMATRDQKMILVSALADNKGFAGTMESMVKVSRHFSYVDHYPFTEKDLRQWEAAAVKHGAEGVVMSRKDFMRMGKWPSKLPVYAAGATVKFLFDGEDDLIALISKKIDG